MSDLIDRHRNVIAPVITFDNEIEMVSAEGAWLIASDGRRYLDFACGISVTNVGRRHPKVIEAARAQIDRLWHAAGTFRFEPIVRAAEALREVAPDPIDMFFFMNSGAEAVEASVKLARFVSKRQAVVVFRGGFHGRTMGSVTYTTSNVKYRKGYSPLLPGVHVTAFPHPYRWGLSPEVAAEKALQELKRLFKHEVPPDEVACFLVEPVQGEGGYYPAPPAFLAGLREMADRYGILMIVDEVQTAFGRTAEFFALDHYEGIRPDVLVLGKAIANGLPLSAVGASRELLQQWPPGSHGTTFGGNAVSCAAAAAVVEAVGELLPDARKLSEHAFHRLAGVKESHPTVGDVRGLGLMIGIELVTEGRTPSRDALEFVRRYSLDHGLLFHPCGPDGNIVRFIPPLVTTIDELDQAIDIIDEAVAVYERR